MEQFNTRYFRGQGKLFIGERDTNGKAVGLQFVGDVGTVNLTPSVERSKKIENVTGQGGIGSSFIKRAEYNLSATMRSIRADALAMALQGTATAKAAGSVTDEAHTVKLGKFSKLEHTNVSSVVVTGNGGTPTYVLNTDYIVHAAEGMIEWLTGGTVTEDLATLIDYSYADQTHTTSSPSNSDKFLVFAGINSADSDKQTRVEIYKVSFDPSVPNLITDEEVDFPLNGVVKLDTLRSAGDQFFSWKTED